MTKNQTKYTKILEYQFKKGIISLRKYQKEKELIQQLIKQKQKTQ